MKKKSLKSKDKSGVALILVIASLMIMSIIIMELTFSSHVDLKISANARNRLQAYYLSQSAARIALLRLKVYRDLETMVTQNSSISSVINQKVPPQVRAQIWSAPLPPFPLPKEFAGDSAGTEEEVESKSPGTMSHLIRTEGSKIPINLLDANPNRRSSKELSDAVREQLTNLWEGKLEDEKFDERFGDIDFEEDLLNPLQDWIDPDKNKLGGGDEDREYEKMEPPYKARNDRMPTLTELYMISGWSDELVNILGPELSVLNNRLEINPNFLSLERLKSIHPDLSLQDLQVIQKRRTEQPFSSFKELESFIRNDEDIRNGKDFPDLEELGFKEGKQETVFIIESTGVVGDARRSVRMGVRIDSTESQIAGYTGPNGPEDDDDQDGVINSEDNCPEAGDENKNADQEDKDNDGIGDVCDEDKPTQLLDPKVINIEEGVFL